MNYNDKIAKSYARAFFKNSSGFIKTKKLEASANLNEPVKWFGKESFTIYAVSEELQLFSSIFINSPKLKALAYNPLFPENKKINIFLTLLPKTSIITESFLRILSEKNQLFLIPYISEEFNKILLNFQKTSKIKIMIAAGLQEELGQSLLKKLQAITNCLEIILLTTYSPKILGGFYLEYGSIAVDYSILSDLNALLDSLKN